MEILWFDFRFNTVVFIIGYNNDHVVAVRKPSLKWLNGTIADFWKQKANNILPYKNCAFDVVK